MIINGKDVGKQLITTNGKWDATKNYKRLCIVYKGGNSYLSKTAVPAGTPLTDEDYWQPFFEMAEPIYIELKEYKEELAREIEALKEAVSITVNSNNIAVDENVKKVVERISAVELSTNSNITRVVDDINNIHKNIQVNVKRLESSVSATNNSSVIRANAINDEILKLKNQVSNRLTQEIDDIKKELSKYATVDTLSVNAETINTLVKAQAVGKCTRIILNKDVDRDSLPVEDMVVGNEVYVIESGLTYVITEVSVTGTITYSLQGNSTIEADYFDEFEAGDIELTADRAIADENGDNIPDTYIKKTDVLNYIKSVFNDMFVEAMPQIYKGSITPDMLSESTKQLLGNKSITNLPDDFLLGIVDKRISMKDVEPDPNNFRSYGHKYLRLNIIDCKNVLEQHMVAQDNTFYYVYLDYDLDGATIKLPENSFFIWLGGSFNNGVINGELTDKLIGKDLTIE